MIKYSLVCRDGHEFEGWFQDGAAYEAQVARAQIACPHCGSNAVDKAIMAPAIAKRAERDGKAAPETSSPPSEHHQILRRIRDEIRAKAEYVGPRFAEEARRIHFDESEPRGIYGEASIEEAQGLAEDGIPFLPVPRLPDDLN